MLIFLNQKSNGIILKNVFTIKLTSMATVGVSILQRSRDLPRWAG